MQGSLPSERVAVARSDNGRDTVFEWMIGGNTNRLLWHTGMRIRLNSYVSVHVLQLSLAADDYVTSVVGRPRERLSLYVDQGTVHGDLKGVRLREPVSPSTL